VGRWPVCQRGALARFRELASAVVAMKPDGPSRSCAMVIAGEHREDRDDEQEPDELTQRAQE